MKLYGVIAVYVQADEILRTPKFWDKLKRAFGGKPDLRTGRMRSAIEATAIVEAVRDAVRRIGVTDAISLVIDDTVLFHDRHGKPDDLGDLFLAFHDNESVFGQGFDELRLAVEHREAGLHVVMELQARSEHARDAAAMRLVISGRVDALTPRPSEDADAYRKRAEPIASDPKALELYRQQFGAFVDRVRDAIAAALPTARAEVEVAEPRVVRPTDQPAPDQNPDARNYDPYVAYYPSPLGGIVDVLMWSALFSMMMPPHFVVVDHHDHVQGHADDPGIQDGPTESAAADDGRWWGDDESASSPAEAPDSGDDGGGGWWDQDGGGDFGGGDFGGFD